MTRMALVLIVSSLLCGWFFQSPCEMELEAKKRDLEAKMAAKGTIVYATADINQGEKFTGTCLVEREVEPIKNSSRSRNQHSTGDW